MSKELEAFDRVWEDCSKLDLDYVSKHNLMDDLREIKKALTPPTADEVCEALSEWLNKEVPDLFNYKVYYDNGGFHYYNTEDFEDYLVEYYEVDKTMTLSVFLPPHLVTLIGRFYEGDRK